MSRAVSPASFAVKGKSRDHGQNQGSFEVSMGLRIRLSGYEKKLALGIPSCAALGDLLNLSG